MEKVLQFGEGNFLRAFAQIFIQKAKDNGENISVAVTQPRTNTKIINLLNAQGCKYNVYIKGRRNGRIVDDTVNIDCVSRCIDSNGDSESLEKLFISNDLELVISNTTEAGICFDENNTDTFPAKTAKLLFKRFNSNSLPLVFLPVELIENNGDELKACILKYSALFGFGSKFNEYVDKCSFCNTLVDRIVTGHISTDSDICSVACEPYASFIIDADDNAKRVLSVLSKYSSDICFCNDLKPYRERKVKILNGAHTMSALAAYMAGFDIVRDMMNDSLFSSYINRGLNEIKATVNMPGDELDAFANSVIERFNNPFINHSLYDISLNSIAKFKSRCLPSIIDYVGIFDTLPKILTFSLAALISFYSHSGTNRVYDVNDSADVIGFFTSLKGNTVKAVLENKSFWGIDLTQIADIEIKVNEYYNCIAQKGISSAISEVLNG